MGREVRALKKIGSIQISEYIKKNMRKIFFHFCRVQLQVCTGRELE